MPLRTDTAVRPVCGPCSNSAKLYQEAPKCEWSGNSALTAHSQGESHDNGPISPNLSVSSDAARPFKQLKRERLDEDLPLQVAALQARIGARYTVC